MTGKRRNSRRLQAHADLAALESALMSGYYGDLPWLDLPTEPGWYWYRTVPSTVVRGPARVRSADGILLGQIFADGGGEKPVDQFQRQWAGPLGRPVPVK